MALPDLVLRRDICAGGGVVWNEIGPRSVANAFLYVCRT